MPRVYRAVNEGLAPADVTPVHGVLLVCVLRSRNEGDGVLPRTFPPLLQQDQQVVSVKSDRAEEPMPLFRLAAPPVSVPGQPQPLLPGGHAPPAVTHCRFSVMANRCRRCPASFHPPESPGTPYRTGRSLVRTPEDPRPRAAAADRPPRTCAGPSGGCGSFQRPACRSQGLWPESVASRRGMGLGPAAPAYAQATLAGAGFQRWRVCRACHSRASVPATQADDSVS